MQINILLPHKEKFTKENAASVSTTVKNNFQYSAFKTKIKIFGQFVEKPMLEKNFYGIKNPNNVFISKNKNLALKMCEIIGKQKSFNQLIEVHNRPYLVNIIDKRLDQKRITLFFHNDPLEMRGSKTIKDRENLLSVSSKIFCVSKYIKKRFLLGIKHHLDKVVVLHNGIIPFCDKIPKKEKTVIFVGRLVKEKGIDLYVDAINNISKNFDDWKFKIIGSSTLGENKYKDSFSKNMVEKFNKIGKNTYVLGYLPPIDLKEIMKKSSIIVIPSTWQEPFGLVAAEAMSFGVAIISSKVGGLSEVISNGGILIENIDSNKIEKSLISLLTCKKLLDKFQESSWKNFRFHASVSSKSLDKHRKELIT